EKTPEPVGYSEAVEFIKDTGYATTSLLQRRYKIGYTQAARLIDRMEAEGVIGPHNGSSPRVLLNNNGEEKDNLDPTPETNEEMDNELPGIAESKPLGENVTEVKEKELEEGGKSEEPAPYF
ncbi:DNA translocase FtsK, partial [Micrococcus sp. SIMBA_144]